MLYLPRMIPPENLTILIKRLKEGWDIRNACAEAKISRSDLYKHFKEMPDFRDKVDKTIDTFNRRKQKKDMLSERHNLMKVKELSRNKK